MADYVRGNSERKRTLATAFETKASRDVMREYHSTRTALREYPAPTNIPASKIDFVCDVEKAIADSGLNRRLLKKLMRWLFDDSAASEANLRQIALVLGPMFLQRKLYPLGRYHAKSDSGWKFTQRKKHRLIAEMKPKAPAQSVSLPPSDSARFYPDAAPVWSQSRFEQVQA